MVKTINIEMDESIFEIINKRRIDNGFNSIEGYLQNIISQIAERIKKENLSKTTLEDNSKENKKNEEKVKKRLAELGYL